jgi:hypothetical protein
MGAEQADLDNDAHVVAAPCAQRDAAAAGARASTPRRA